MAITKIQSGALPADVITTAAIDDASVTHAKLHTTMDLSSKTVTLPTLSTLNTTGSVGVGTSSIATGTKLIIKAATDQNFEVEYTSGGKLRLSALNDARSANVPLQFTSTSFEFLSGNVGIGTTNPDSQLHVHGVGTLLSSDSYFVAQIQTDRNDDGSNDDGILQFVNGSAKTVKGEIRWDESTNTFELGHGDNQGHLVIASGGNVGIGTTSPSSELEVAGSSDVDTGILVTNSRNGVGMALRLDNTSNGANKGSGIKWQSGGFNIGSIITRADTTAVSGDSPGYMTFHTSNDGAEDLAERMRIDSGGNVGIGTSTPTEQLHLYKAVTNGGHHTYMKLHQYQPDLGGIGEHGSFIDFDFQDNNDNHRPQVQIGAELGNRNETDTGQEGEGRGNFVVKTSNGASPYNPAYGTSATEVFRVTYDGYINAKGAIINSKKIQSSTSTNSTNTSAVVIAASSITMTKRNHDQSRFLYSVVLSHEVDGQTTNTNGFLKLEYRISSLGQTSFTALGQVITVGGMSDYSGGTNNNSFQQIFTPPNFNKNETIEMRLVFSKSNAQSVHFNQQNLASQPSGTSNHTLGYVLEMGL